MIRSFGWDVNLFFSILSCFSFLFLSILFYFTNFSGTNGFVSRFLPSVRLGSLLVSLVVCFRHLFSLRQHETENAAFTIQSLSAKIREKQKKEEYLQFIRSNCSIALLAGTDQ